MWLTYAYFVWVTFWLAWPTWLASWLDAELEPGLVSARARLASWLDAELEPGLVSARARLASWLDAEPGLVPARARRVALAVALGVVEDLERARCQVRGGMW